jgi:RNA polymerase sigma-70 factor (ECF subfamily)
MGAIQPAPESVGTVSAAAPEEVVLLESLRRGDEDAFISLVDTYHASLVRLARVYVSDAAVAEEVAQETWIAVLRGLDRFEGRSSFKTWLFRILTNRAKTRGQREGRIIPFSVAWHAEDEPFEPAVDPERFLPADHPQWPGHWATAPREWGDDPEAQLLTGETTACIREAVELLPPSQREVITLRDIEGLSSEEVCGLLGISEGNQRVLLHRARSKVRRALEQYLVGV